MKSPFHRDASPWRVMATVQVAEGAPDVAAILADLDFDFRLEPVPSPPGVRWFDLLIDARRGRQRCERVAHRLLTALQSIAKAGDLERFRIVAGEQWLDEPGTTTARRTFRPGAADGAVVRQEGPYDGFRAGPVVRLRAHCRRPRSTVLDRRACAMRE